MPELVFYSLPGLFICTERCLFKFADTLAVTERMSWKLVMKKGDPESRIAIAVFQKPIDNKLYDLRTEDAAPFCEPDDKPDAAWCILLPYGLFP